MHRGYLDQAIAFKREQSREQRSRGRRHSSQQDEWLDRQRREQREQAFSTYFNGANEGRAAPTGPAESAAQRRPDRRRDSLGAADEAMEAAEQKRRGWRKQEREITGKITQQSTPPQPPQPPQHDIPPPAFTSPTTPTPSTATSDTNQHPFASPSSQPPLAFHIQPSAAGGGVVGVVGRRRTWCRGGVVELRGEDGEVVRLEPRVLHWDAEAGKGRGPVTCRRRVEAQLRGEAVEEDDEQPVEQKRSTLVGPDSDERAEAEEDTQTGEDTSAEVSYSGRAQTSSDDNRGLSSRSSQSPRRTPSTAADAARAQTTLAVKAAVHGERSRQLASANASPGPTPPLSPAPPPPRMPAHVTPLDFSALFSSSSHQPSPSAATPQLASHPLPTVTDAAVAGTRPAAFGRRASRSERERQMDEAKDDGRDERKEAEEDGEPKRGTAWQISLELTAEEQEQMKQREDRAEKERQMVQQRREARAGRRAKRSTAPSAVPSSTAVSTADSTATAAAAGRHSRPRRHTANDAVGSRAPPAADHTRSTAAAAATEATDAAVAEVLSHTLDDLQRSWDDLDQFLATELASLSSTAATRKNTRLSVTHTAATPAVPAVPAAQTASNDGDEADDDYVDSVINDFLASTPSAASSATSVSTSRIDSSTQPHSRLSATAAPPHPLPVLPAGSHLILRVLSVWPGATLSADAAGVRKVECYNDAGSLIHVIPLPAASSPQPSAGRFSFSFSSRHRISLIRLFNSAATLCGLREVELLLDDRVIFRGEIAAGSCESLLFTRDQALIGRVLRTMHASAEDVTKRQQPRPAISDKRDARLWRDGVEVMYRPANAF